MYIVENIDKIIAARIRIAREGPPKLSQTAAAELCGLPPVTYQRAEDPKKSTSVKTLFKIAKGFNRPIDWFFGEEYTHFGTEQALKVISDALRSKDLIK